MNTEDKININDKLVMSIGVVFFGIVIPNATGLIEHSVTTLYKLVTSYLYFIFVAFVIWYGNRFLFFKVQEKYEGFHKPWVKIMFLVLSNVFYTAPVTAVLISLYYILFKGSPVDYKKIEINVFVCVVCVIFVSQVYEAIFLAKKTESERIKSEQLERAKAEAQLEALKNQIDPHFMYNALNSLAYLIDNSPADAKRFVESLAEIYRYILGNKERTLVLLEDELLFLRKYLSLLDIRFSSSLKVDFENINMRAGEFLIPPNSLFIAVENVVKHNELSRQSPVRVDFFLEDNRLIVENRVHKKKSGQFSSKVGLKNLDERFKLIVGEGIKTILEDGIFRLQMPMLRLNN